MSCHWKAYSRSELSTSLLPDFLELPFFYSIRLTFYIMSSVDFDCAFGFVLLFWSICFYVFDGFWFRSSIFKASPLHVFCFELDCIVLPISFCWDFDKDSFSISFFNLEFAFSPILSTLPILLFFSILICKF